MSSRDQHHPPSTGPSPEEAVAIAAAIERFVQDTAARLAAPAPAAGGWARAALLEGVARAEPLDVLDHWTNT